ncbi:hypothetical protein [Candidatus Wolbachia massiliensis]|nr:hypothetical protein [Candidatus Wolbachia massiliensis]
MSLPKNSMTLLKKVEKKALDLLQNSVKDGKVRKRGMRSEGK